MTDEKKPIRTCVMGWPVSQSLSPKMHTYWLKKYGINGVYTAMAIGPEQLKEAFALIRDRGYAGCNLTAPLKEAGLQLMQEHDESCLFSGAVNTVVFNKDGTAKGFNSDGFGFMESLKAQIPKWNGARVVILGTGGAARGVIIALRAAGAKHFLLVNRTKEKAEKVKKQFTLDSTIVPWEHRNAALKDATLLVNCSTLGMKDNPPLDIDVSKIPSEAGVADLVYRPLRTKLLLDAQKRGLKTAEGLPMLLHQGRLGFEHWFGKDPEVTRDLYDEIARAAF